MQKFSELVTEAVEFSDDGSIALEGEVVEPVSSSSRASLSTSSEDSISSDQQLPDFLQNDLARSLLEKIDEGIAVAERGMEHYFYSSPKRAIEFQQNHIAYLELKAKILRLISDTKAGVSQVNLSQSNIIVDEKTVQNIRDLLVQRLYGASTNGE